MNKLAIIWLTVGLVAGAALFHTEISNAVYSIPPTNAFSNVTIDGTLLLADSYRDELAITAGSGISLTPNVGSDSFVIAATGGGGASNSGANSTASYIIDYDGSDIIAINGTTGAIEFIDNTNASKTIQFAIDSLAVKGGLIFIKSGVYIINETIDFRGDQTIAGENRGATKLFLANNCDCDLFKWDSTNPAEDNFQIKDLTLNGNSANNVNGSGLVINATG